MIVDRNSDGLLLATLRRVLEARRGPSAEVLPNYQIVNECCLDFCNDSQS